MLGLISFFVNLFGSTANHILLDAMSIQERDIARSCGQLTYVDSNMVKRLVSNNHVAKTTRNGNIVDTETGEVVYDAMKIKLEEHMKKYEDVDIYPEYGFDMHLNSMYAEGEWYIQKSTNKKLAYRMINYRGYYIDIYDGTIVASDYGVPEELRENDEKFIEDYNRIQRQLKKPDNWIDRRCYYLHPGGNNTVHLEVREKYIEGYRI